jgi:hypothetical protein
MTVVGRVDQVYFCHVAANRPVCAQLPGKGFGEARRLRQLRAF